MRPQDIKISEYYRFRNHPDYSYARALEILKPRQGTNDKTYTVVKCEHVVYKNDTMGCIKYFMPLDLIKDN